MVTITIEKRHLYFFSVITGIIIGILAVNAYDDPPLSWPGNPSSFGHSVNEIDWSQSINSSIDVLGSATFQGNNLFVRNPKSPSGSQTWGIVVSTSTGRFNLGQGTDSPPSSLTRIPFIIEAEAPTSSFIMDSSGKVGLGVNPDSKLHVEGDLQYEGKLKVPSTAIYTITISCTGSFPHICVAACNPGDIVLGGGFGTTANLLLIGNSRPISSSQWECKGDLDLTSCYARCLDVA